LPAQNPWPTSACRLELALFLLAVGLLAPVTGVPSSTLAAAVAGLAALALGLQNATVRHLAVPDLTTTVLTMTLTGIAADIRSAARPVITRRLLAVATMFLGALLGGLLVLNLQLAWALAPVPALLTIVATVLTLHVRKPAPWQHRE
jgi:uncharacterized membrane protein YoaK (UPF0700 family)